MLIQQTLEELEDEEVELLTAANGEEALSVIETAKPNLVFLDVMMPRLSGFDVCDRAKHDPWINRRVHRAAHGQRTGVRSTARPAGRRRSVHDEAVRSRRARAEGARRARHVTRGVSMTRVELGSIVSRQKDSRAVLAGLQAALGTPVVVADSDGRVLLGNGDGVGL